uniref:Uncharacterized protein n=1 Tax=Salvator merianae TaxID=96440 RepID=A0A8D0KEZ9_SALMN
FDPLTVKNKSWVMLAASTPVAFWGYGFQTCSQPQKTLTCKPGKNVFEIGCCSQVTFAHVEAWRRKIQLIGYHAFLTETLHGIPYFVNCSAPTDSVDFQPPTGIIVALASLSVCLVPLSVALILRRASI